MFRNWFKRLWSAPGHTPSRKEAPTFRPVLDTLEARIVPTFTSPFILTSTNRLMAATDNTQQNFRFTGVFATQVSVGEISPAGGAAGAAQFAVVRDGNNRVFWVDGATNAITDTGGFAVDVQAGRGEFFIRDGNNQINVFNLQTGAYTPFVAFATQMSVGWDNVNRRDFLAFRAGDNSVFTLENGIILNTGGFAIDIKAGQHAEFFIRAGDNGVSAFNGVGGANPAYVNLGGFALSMDVGLATAADDYLAFRSGTNQLFVYDTVANTNTNTGGFATVIWAGQGQVFFADGNKTLNFLTLEANPTFTNTGLTVSRLNVTNPPAFGGVAPANPNTVTFLDANNEALVLVAGKLPPIDTGFVARDVRGDFVLQN